MERNFIILTAQKLLFTKMSLINGIHEKIIKEVHVQKHSRRTKSINQYSTYCNMLITLLQIRSILLMESIKQIPVGYSVLEGDTMQAGLHLQGKMEKSGFTKMLVPVHQTTWSNTPLATAIRD